MRKQSKSTKNWLGKRTKREFRGYPAATIALYGPTAERASKIVVAVFRARTGDPDFLERWFSEEGDVRSDPDVGAKVLAFLRTHAAKSVAVMDGIIGCPHEEGIDYPVGTSCPQCPYWAGRDRFTHECIH